MAFIQSNSSFASKSQGISCPFTFAQQAGDTNIVVVSTNSATDVGIAIIADTRGSVYTLISGPTASGSLTQWIYSAKL